MNLLTRSFSGQDPTRGGVGNVSRSLLHEGGETVNLTILMDSFRRSIVVFEKCQTVCEPVPLWGIPYFLH